jgi:hypothetical protein
MDRQRSSAVVRFSDCIEFSPTPCPAGSRKAQEPVRSTVGMVFRTRIASFAAIASIISVDTPSV